MAEAASSLNHTFNLLTYNINDEQTSASAPWRWTLDQQHDGLAALIQSHRPDLLCLQECFKFPARLKAEYDFQGSARSHRGCCVIATRKDGPLKVAGDATAVGPCVLAPLVLAATGRVLTAACVHLAPFGEFAPVRAKQVEAVVRAAPEGFPLVLAGDFNMREKERVLGLDDAWAASGAPEAERWSWDTRVNRYYEGGRAYTARYDRVLYRGFEVRNFRLVGNEPFSGSPGHFLSDHFGLLVQLQLT